MIGWENIELISDRPLEVMLDEFARLKKEFPGRILIASIMEEYDRVRSVGSTSSFCGWGRLSTACRVRCVEYPVATPACALHPDRSPA